MPRHKDFEIWYDEEKQKYRFSVEYWGAYSADTKEEIQKKATRVRSAVKRRLKEIDAENKAYYKRLEQKERELLSQLKEHRKRTRVKESIKFSDLTPSEQRALIKMIEKDYDEIKIKSRFDINSHTIAALKQKRKEHVCTNIQPDETLSNTSRNGIVLPWYSADVIGNRYTGCIRDE